MRWLMRWVIFGLLTFTYESSVFHLEERNCWFTLKLMLRLPFYCNRTIQLRIVLMKIYLKICLSVRSFGYVRTVRTSPNRSVFTRDSRSSQIKWLGQSFPKIQKGQKIFSIIIWVTFSVFKCTKKSCPSCCLCFGWNIIDNWNCKLCQNKCARNWENVSWHVSS